MIQRSQQSEGAAGAAQAPARRRPQVAVLAVQGAFIEHEKRLRALGCTVTELRKGADADQPFDGLVLPGGESTAQSKMLHELGLFEPLRRRIAEGMPVLGTCAGLILLAERIEGTGDLRNLDAAMAANRAAVRGFQTLDVTVCRNAYGRQLGSFHAEGLWEGPQPTAGVAADTATPVPLTFIRAPRIDHLGADVVTLVSLDGTPVAVRQGNQIAATSHPELDEDDRLYRAFLDALD